MPEPQIFRKTDGTIDRQKTADGWVISLKSWGGIVTELHNACVESHAAPEG